MREGNIKMAVFGLVVPYSMVKFTNVSDLHAVPTMRVMIIARLNGAATLKTAIFILTALRT
jgi:hypothetical protein